MMIKSPEIKYIYNQLKNDNFYPPVLLVQELAEYATWSGDEDTFQQDAYEALISAGLTHNNKEACRIAAYYSLNVYLQGHVSSARYAYDLCENMEMLQKADPGFFARALIADQYKPDVSIEGIPIIESEFTLPTDYSGMVAIVGFNYLEKFKKQPTKADIAIKRLSEKAAQNLYGQGMTVDEISFLCEHVSEGVKALATKKDKSIEKITKLNPILKTSSHQFSQSLADVVGGKIKDHVQQNIIPVDKAKADLLLLALDGVNDFESLKLIAGLGNDKRGYGKTIKDIVVNAGDCNDEEYSNLTPYQRMFALAEAVLK